MTRSTRRILFVGAVLIFVIAGYVSLLYAQGYKYNFADQKFSRTGAIAIKSNVDAQVNLNGGSTKKTSFFGNSASVDGLLPGTYTVRVEQAGYYLWQKKAAVQEGLVTDFPKVMLISNKDEDQQDLQTEITSLLYPKIASVSASSKSEDGKKTLQWTTHEIWVMWQGDSNYQPFHKQDDKELITRFASPIKKAGWFRDSDHFVVEAGSRYYVLEIDTRGGVNIVKI